jgi:excisionase family DNA binding protein
MSQAEAEGQLRSAYHTATRLGVSKPTLCRLMQRGEIGFYRVGTRVLFSDEHIKEFLNRVEHKPRNAQAAK